MLTLQLKENEKKTKKILLKPTGGVINILAFIEL